MPVQYLDSVCGQPESILQASFQARVAQCTSSVFGRLQTFQFHIKRKILKYDNIGDVKAALSSLPGVTDQAINQCELLKTPIVQPGNAQFPDAKQPLNIPFDRTKLFQTFPAAGMMNVQCAALILPYRNYPLGEFINVNKPEKMQSLNITQEEVLFFKDIVTHTPRPAFIRELASRFVHQVMGAGRDFIGIHWAY